MPSFQKTIETTLPYFFLNEIDATNDEYPYFIMEYAETLGVTTRNKITLGSI